MSLRYLTFSCLVFFSLLFSSFVPSFEQPGLVCVLVQEENAEIGRREWCCAAVGAVEEARWVKEKEDRKRGKGARRR